MLVGSAQNLPWLFTARGLQAVGAAAVQGTGMAIAVTVFGAEERGKALGLMATVVAFAAVSGPVLGGVLIDAVSWRAIFFVSAVVGPIGAALTYKVLREEHISQPIGREERRLDWYGMITSAVALVFTLLLFSRGPSQGWTSSFILGSGAVAASSWIAFFWVEVRAEHPMIDLALFRRRLFAMGGMASWLAFTATSSMLIMMPFYLQGILDFEPREAALIMTPSAFMLAVCGPFSGRLSDRIGTRFPLRPACCWRPWAT